MEIDDKAPVTARAEAYIGATPAQVWALLADVEHWPLWNPDVKDAQQSGRLAPGTVIMWRVGHELRTSTVREAREPEELGWTGRAGGVDAEHVFRLVAQGGGTKVISMGSWSGLKPRLLPGRLTRDLQRSLERGLEYIDAEFGRRAIAAAARELQLAGATPEAAEETAAEAQAPPEDAGAAAA